MSSDLLAEFDSFYTAPRSKQSTFTPASNDLAMLGGTTQNGQTAQSGSFGQWQQPVSKPAQNIWGGIPPSQPSTKIQQANVVEDDIWGSFEDAEPTPTANAFPSSAKGFTSYDRVTAASKSKPQIVRRPTIDLFSGTSNYSPQNTQPLRAPVPKPVPARQSSSGGEILFDADDVLSPDVEDDDDFGDFESVTSPAPVTQAPPQPQPSQSLNYLFSNISIEPKSIKRPKELQTKTTTLNVGPLPYPQAPKSPSFQERNPFSDLGLSMKKVAEVKKSDNPSSASPITAWPSFEPPKPEPYQDSPAAKNPLDDDWGDFADLPPETPAEKTAKAVSGIQADAWAWDNADHVPGISAVPPRPVNTAPPTNIPPPSILLTLFPLLFDLPKSALFGAVANQPFSLKNRILSDPSTITFLRAYLLIGIVAARVIAGRKLRWKRDTILSQAMKIGPAAAGGKGGMKLAGVDKAETTREDREAAEAVRVWKEQLGRLKSAVAVANTSMSDTSQHLVIPEINEVMHVRTQEGAMTAPKPCLICGLKREERILKVDVQVEDSFGEWWVEHWGHRACRNLWLEHESKLKHR